MFLAAFLCSVIAVHDGDTLRCRGGTRVRLEAIDAPEVGECPRYRTCAPGDALASRRALRRMALGKTIRCQGDGHSYDRIVAWCAAGGVDLSCAMYRGGYAVRRWDYNHRLCRSR